MRGSGLRIGGTAPLTTVDYPDRLAAVIFCQGCPWRCVYCQNSHLQPRRGRTEVPWERVEAFLARRRGLLEAVVFSGGEPTVQEGLPDAVQRVGAMGFRVGLHTAGPSPERLARVLPWLDWVGLDVKAPFADCGRITGVADSGRRTRESVLAVLRWGGAYEIRTTVHPRLLPADALTALAVELARLGVRRYALQRFRPQGCEDAALCAAAVGEYPDPALCGRLGALFPSFTVR